METIELLFKREKETKGAYRYQECDGETGFPKEFKGSVCGTIYFRKDNVPQDFPLVLKVSINSTE